MKTHHTLTALLIVCAGCSETDSVTSDATENNYRFVDAESWTTIDTLGVALTSTALTNRDDGYNDDAPYRKATEKAALLITFRKYLARMHSWVDEAGLLEDIDVQPGQDFSSCAGEIGFSCDEPDDGCITAVTPCTLQKIGQEGQGKRKVLDVVLPDHITINVTELPGFPNGRPLYRIASDGTMRYEQINDLVLAMGFLDMGAECTADPSGVCSVRTFADMINPDGSRGLNKQENDKPLQLAFPYLAAPHGIDAADGYWPERGY
jgi:hypothetical protein